MKGRGIEFSSRHWKKRKKKERRKLASQSREGSSRGTRTRRRTTTTTTTATNGGSSLSSRGGATGMQCGLCAVVAGLFRRAMCIAGSRRGSGESCYQEISPEIAQTRRHSQLAPIETGLKAAEIAEHVKEAVETQEVRLNLSYEGLASPSARQMSRPSYASLTLCPPWPRSFIYVSCISFSNIEFFIILRGVG